jgi:hypothetical protein
MWTWTQVTNGVTPRTAIILSLVFFTFSLTTTASVTQEDLQLPQEGNTQVVKLMDGSVLYGRITEIRPGEITFESTVGSMTIDINNIDSIEEVTPDRFRGGKYWFPNPNRTRMYIGSTARMLEKGKGYFLDIYVFFPSLAYALTDNITLSAGASLFPAVDAEDQLYYGTLKVGVPATEKLSVAASGLILRVPNWDDDDDLDEPVVVGALSGIGTYGTDDASVTLGLGFGYADDDFADKPLVTLGGEYRFARRMSFVSENWIIPEVEDPLISYGLRFFGEGIAVDLAFVNVASSEAIFPGIPYISFVYNF